MQPKIPQIWIALAAVALACLFAVRGEVGLRRQSPVWDERLHMGYGLLFWQDGPRFDGQDHPYPLAALLAAPSYGQVAGPDRAAKLVLEDPKVLWPARRVDVALGLAGLLLAAWWAARRFGQAVGLLTLAAGSFDPAWMAVSRLVLTDIGLGVAFMAGGEALVRHRQTGQKRWLIAAGAALAAGLCAKWSALLLLPAAATVMLLPEGDGTAWRQRLLRAAAACAAVGAIGVGLFALVFVVQGIWHGVAVVDALVHPWRGFVAAVGKRAHPHGVFLLGHWFTASTAWYFPALLAAKMPVGALAGAGLAVGLPSARAELMRHRLWLVAPAVYLLAAVASRQNIGFRHLTPVFPLLWTMAALGLRHLWLLAKPQRALAVAVGAAAIAEPALAFPHELAFANGLFGGLGNAPNVAVDAAGDWGQALPDLADALAADRAQNQLIDLAYFGNADPTGWVGPTRWRPCGALGRLPPPTGPRAGCMEGAKVFAVSATCLQGAAGLRKGRKWSPTERDDCYAWLRGREPDQVVGGAILIYRDVTPAAADSPPLALPPAVSP